MGLAFGGAAALAQPSQTDQPNETPQGQSDSPAPSNPPATSPAPSNSPSTSTPSGNKLEPLVVEKPATQPRRTVPVANPAPARSAPVAVPNRNPSATVRTQRTAGPARAPRTAPAGPSQAGPSQGAQAKPETGTGPVKGFVATRSDTAMKTDTPIIETPQSIEVVPRDQLEAQQVWTAKEALRYSAGVVSDSRSNFGLYDIMYNRGFVVDRYLDGMKLQGNTGFVTPQVDLYGMERVELLRGPASVMFGQGSPGGLVNMVSKRPLDQPFGGEVELQGGSYDRFQGAFDVGGRVDPEGQYLWRLTGDMRQADNQVQFIQEEHRFIAPAFTWHPNPDTTFTILANYQVDPKGGLYNFVPAVGSVMANPNGQIPTRFYAGDPNYNLINRTQYGAGYVFEQNIGPVFTFRQGLRYLDTTGNLNQVLPLGLEADNVTLDRYVQQDGERISSFTMDNNLQAKFATGPIQHTMLFGVDYQQTLWTQLLAQDFTSSINIYNPAYYQPIALTPFADFMSTHQKQEQMGVYVQEQAKIGNLILVGAGRRDHAHSDTLFGDTYANNGVVGNTEQNDYATTGRVGLVYLLDGGWAPYALHATSFNPTPGTEFGGTPFKPTTGTLNEGGVRYSPAGLNLMITASYYDIVEENVLTPDPVHLGFLTQTGQIRSNGWEVEARASVTNQLDLIGSYTYINAKVTQSNDVDLNKVPLWIPRNMASGWVDYTFRDGPLNGLGFAVGERFVGYTYGNPSNSELIPAYTLTDAALHYDLATWGPELKGYRFSVNATNLFDKVYVSECTNANCLYGLRRKVLATLRYRW